MRNKLLLLSFSLIIFAIIIISGCGGENGITQPSSSLTLATSDKIAYIIINVKWPKGDIPGSFIISSADNKNELTASMTKDTRRIEIRIYEDKSTPGGDPIGTEAIGMATIKEPDTTAKIPVHIKNNSDDADPNDPNTPGVLPVVPVKIWAGAFSDRDGDSLVNPISETLKDYTVVIGNNAINLQLGNYDLTLRADPNSIVLGGSTVSGSSLISNVTALPTPTPGRTVVKNNLTPMNPCMAEITPEGSPLPTDTPTPTPTPIRVYADITATLMIKYPTPTVNPTANTDTTTPLTPTPKFVANKRITFTLIQGNDEGTTLSLDGTTDPNTVSGTTNNNGTSTAKLSTSTAGDKVIKASFQADPNDPNSIYTKYTTISVAVTTPTPTPTRVGTAIVVPNLSGNWKHTGVGARYTINQHGTDLCYLTFTRIDAGTPTPSPEPTNTPASYPTSTPLWNSYWEGTWNGILTSSYNNSMCVSMYPNNTEHVTGYISNNNNTIDWYGTDSKIHYSRWVRE